MAQPATTASARPTAPPALAGVLAPTEWLATGAPAPEAPPAEARAPEATTPSPPPPCPPSLHGASATNGAASAPTSNGAAVLADGRVVLNLATPTELTTLPGIGQKRAEAIIALRTKLKGFRKLSELLRVKGIGVKSLKKLELKLVLDAPAPAG